MLFDTRTIWQTLRISARLRKIRLRSALNPASDFTVALCGHRLIKVGKNLIRFWKCLRNEISFSLR